MSFKALTYTARNVRNTGLLTVAVKATENSTFLILTNYGLVMFTDMHPALRNAINCC